MGGLRSVAGTCAGWLVIVAACAKPGGSGYEASVLPSTAVTSSSPSASSLEAVSPPSEAEASTADDATRTLVAETPEPALPPEIEGMIYIPEGPFIAGPIEEAAEPTKIELGAYYIDRLETSVDEYAECVEAGICREPLGCSRFCTWKKRTRTGDHAVNCVAWEDARNYCEWRDKRLPSELEWEKAARGTDGRLMPWGAHAEDMPSPLVGRCKDIHVWTTARGCHPWDVSPFGLMDTAGGVFEWVVGWPDETLDQSVVDARAPSVAGFRGGSDRVGRNHWKNLAQRHRVPTYSRWGWTTSKRMSMFDHPGFRCATDGVPPSPSPVVARAGRTTAPCSE